eukprot:s3790_g16.t1
MHILLSLFLLVIYGNHYAIAAEASKKKQIHCQTPVALPKLASSDYFLTSCCVSAVFLRVIIQQTDAKLAEKVQETKDALQEARERVDVAKESLAKEDEVALRGQDLQDDCQHPRQLIAMFALPPKSISMWGMKTTYGWANGRRQFADLQIEASAVK